MNTYGMTEEQYWAWRADCCCEGCGAVPDQEHRSDCGIWLDSLDED